MSGERVAAAARALVGTRFRLHGRDAASGVDCVGLAALALREAGTIPAVPTGYAMRGGSAAGAAALLDVALTRADGERAGDVLLLRSGPGQLHLAIRTGNGIVHADAALRRVVERPGEAPWPLITAWRIGEG